MTVSGIEELSGVLPALVTPLHRDGSADESGIKRLVEHVISGGVHGLLPLGSTGEGAALGERTRCLFFNATTTAAIYTLSLHDALPIRMRSNPRNSRIGSSAP